jgi:hypothetical protein
MLRGCVACLRTHCTCLCIVPASVTAPTILIGTLQAQQNPTWQVRHRGKWAGSLLYLKSKTSAFQLSYSTCKGPADSVLAFWKALGFKVAYDIVKDGVTGICHSAGFAVTAVWSKVCSAVRHDLIVPLCIAHPRRRRTSRAADCQSQCGPVAVPPIGAKTSCSRSPINAAASFSSIYTLSAWSRRLSPLWTMWTWSLQRQHC